MPTPCTNCVRFHYGPCRELPKQCYICGGVNHIERYCPNGRNTIRRVPGEPLAGTAKWCEWHGLNDDPELKQKVLQALKTTPGSAIHVNGICIYRGNDKHFSNNGQHEPPRGRTLAERITHRRSRSMSPGRGRRRSASRSLSLGRRGRAPSPHRGSQRYQAPVHQPRYRSRSPLRQRLGTPSLHRQPQQRTPSPYRQTQYRPRSPRYANDSNVVIFEARDRQLENRQPGNYPPPSREAGRLTPIKFNLPPCQPAPRALLPPRYHASQFSAPLKQVSHNIPKNDQETPNTTKSPPLPSAPRSETIDLEVDDPYFVLGVEKGASEAEILGAYQQQIYEIDLERLAGGVTTSNSSSVWNESIKILNTAKKQLLGY